MATEKIINTRIQLKYDTLANWNANSSLVLKQGEVGICAIPTAPTTDPDKKLQVTPPAIMFKVGDGVTPFGSLNWASALAADVYAWAKKSVPAVADFGDIIAAAREGLISADSVVKTLNGLKGEITLEGDSHITVTTGTDKVTFAFTMTDAEKAALDSGITSELVTKYNKYDERITAVTTTAGAALPKTEFETFKTSNDTAISEAKQAGLTASQDLASYRTTNDAAVSKNTTAISNLQEAMKSGITFKGKLDSKPAVTDYSNGDLIIVDKKEYILYDNGTAKEWIELGDEGSHLTKVTADGYYVPLSRTIAGKQLDANITAADMRTALNIADGATKVVESTVSSWGFTKNKGTVITVKMNGANKTTSAEGVVDLGTVITDISGKQDNLTADQIEAVNSGITSDKVATYDGYATSKQATLTTTQMDVVNSGITAAKVTTYDGYADSISALENKPGLDKVGTVTEVTAGVGLKVSGTASVAPKVEIDDSVVFVFNCGSATELVD